MSNISLKNQTVRELAFIVTNIIVKDETYKLKHVLEELEREVILNMMVFTDENQSEASRLLGLSRQALIYKLKQYKSDDIQLDKGNK